MPTRDPTLCVLRRIAAALLDTVIILTPLLLVAFATRIIRVIPQRLIYSWGWAGILAVWGIAIVYWTLFERSSWGATLGKRLLRIQVVKADGTPGLSWREAIVRNVVRVVDQFVGWIVGPILMLTTSGHRRLGDIAAHTLVVKKRSVGTILATRTPHIVGA